MSSLDREEWGRLRNQGKTLYLLTHWIISCALPVAVIMSLIRGILRGGLVYFFSKGYIYNLFLSVILFSVISLLLGIRKWNKNEQLYNSNRANA